MNKGSTAPNLLARLGLLFIVLAATVIFFVLMASLSVSAAAAENPLIGYGPDPQLPPARRPLVPVLNAPDAIGWTEGQKPVPAQGLEVSAFVTDLDHPRQLYVLPNGDVLVVETNAPADRPDDSKGIKGLIFRLFLSRAGAGTPSANHITLLRDADGDGTPELRTIFLDGLNSPFGMALVGNTFYVANTDAVVSFPYEEGQTEITAEPTKVTDLPAGTINHHWTKGLIASEDGSKLYVSVGSNSDVAENGLEAEKDRAAILEVDPQTGTYRVFASGLRNPVSMAWEPESGALWTVVNERDELGNDLVPDYMTSVQDGGFYGWPYSYWGQHVEPRIEPQNPDLVAKAIMPDYGLGSHTAPLGLTSSVGTTLPDQFTNGMFVGQHGSWNRIPRNGYQVIFIPFTSGMPTGDPVVVLSGFIEDDGDAKGRPVGVALDASGALLVADDVGNTIWRVTETQGAAAK
jgi:glucose/arabinose dehydrogenase